MQDRQERTQFFFQRERWIDHHHAGTVEARLARRRSDLKDDIEQFRDARFPQRLAESRDSLSILDRVPERIDATRPTLAGLGQAADNAVELALFLEGRIDQNKATFFLGREMGSKRQP